MDNKFQIFTDGACKGNPGPGGWAAIVRGEGEQNEDLELAGNESQSTNNRMEILAAIKGLEAVPDGSKVLLVSDSLYLINTMTKGWKRRANKDLWGDLDQLVSNRKVTWHWIKGHAGHPENERADRLAASMADQIDTNCHQLTHIDDIGEPVMVDVGQKSETERQAVAKGSVVMKRATLDLVERGALSKGNVLSVARLAGIMGAKKTSDLIPLCHPLPIDQIQMDMYVDNKNNQVNITATVKTTAKTGVEMEALTAVSVAALTIYDMCKAVDKGIHIESIRLVKKLGGKSGDVVLE